MLAILALCIVLFVVAFLDTGVSLDEYSERLLYVPEEDEVATEAPRVAEEPSDFKTATVDAAADADEMLERIYGDGK